MGQGQKVLERGEEDRNTFRLKVGSVEMRGRKLDDDWEIIEEKVKRTVEEIKKKREKEKVRRREWWNKECEAKKREVRRKLREWRRIGEGR